MMSPLSSDIWPGVRKKMFTCPFEEQMNSLLSNELEKRIPKTKPYIVLESPTLAPWHRMTGPLNCRISLPEIKTQDPQEALTIFLPYARAYIDTLNNVREIRPYLTSFPYPENFWSVCVDFARDPKTGWFFYAPFISRVSCSSQRCIVDRLYKEKKYPDGSVFKNINENILDIPEGYPEPIKKMMSPRFDEKKEPTAIPVATKYVHFNNSGEPEFQFCQKWARENGVLLVGLESILGQDRPYGTKIQIGIAYAAQGKLLSLDEAKALVLKLRNDHLPFYIKEEWLQSFVNCARASKNESLDPKINAQEYMSYRISFWDEYIDRVKPPHIAEIKVIGTTAKYYVADDLQRLQLIYEEELSKYEVEVPVSDEALAILAMGNISK